MIKPKIILLTYIAAITHFATMTLPVYSQEQFPTLFRGTSFGFDSDEERSENFSPFSNRLDTLENLQKSGPGSKGKKKGMLQKLTFGGSWVPSFGDGGMGLARFDTTASLGLPGPKFMAEYQSFFLVSPRFGYTYVDWNRNTEFPDSLYTAGLGLTMMQQISENKSLMFTVTPSYSSDGKASSDAFRCSATLGLNWTFNPRLQIILGVAYLDRDDVNIMPFGGLIWTPTPDWRIELIAPMARAAKRIDAWSDSSVKRWAYLGGGFEGGNWAVKSSGGRSDFAMYREFSFLIGLETERTEAATWNLELGYLFARRMEFDHDTQSTYKPDDSLVLRLKWSF